MDGKIYMGRVGDTSDSHKLKWNFLSVLSVKIVVLSKLTEQTRERTLINLIKKWNGPIKRQ